jgi:cytoskeletal protein CcmA (bactofilin family)
MGERGSDIALACEHCHHQWSRASRRVGRDRRQRAAATTRERRERDRRGQGEVVPLPAADAGAHGPSVATPAVAGHTLEIRGEVVVSDDYLLDGHVRGSVSVPAHTLTVTTAGDVVATLSARIVIVQGAVLGNITAAERITLERGSRVKGDLRSAALILEDGAEFTGRVIR